MIEVDCRLHDSETAVAHSSTLRFHPDGSVVRGDPSPCTTRVDQLEISERLGRIPRRITFPDGAACEVDDHDVLERALRMSRAPGSRTGGWLHALETRWHWAVSALVLSVGLVYFGIADGIPWLSARVAPTIPYEIRLELGLQALSTFDRTSAEASELPVERQEALRARFRDLVEWAHLPESARLEFRKIDKIGANAFAFPGGIVVVTDALVELAGNDEEIVSVLAHELGHVEHLHGMRKLLQNTGISVVIIAVSGDVSWLATAIPTTLLAARYSREFERQADSYARRYMQERGIPLHAFVDLLRRMEEQSKGGTAPEFLASHPGFEERADAFR